MYITRKVGPKGQVVIPEALRAQFDITPGTEVMFDTSGGAIIINLQKSAEEVLSAFRKIRESPSRKKSPTMKDLERWYDEQLDERNGLR